MHSGKLRLGNHGSAEIDVFNGSGTTANVAVHFLAKNGANLAGYSISGTNPVVTYPVYPGHATPACSRPSIR